LGSGGFGGVGLEWFGEDQSNNHLSMTVLLVVMTKSFVVVCYITTIFGLVKDFYAKKIPLAMCLGGFVVILVEPCYCAGSMTTLV
jgi:hypothetical protein